MPRARPRVQRADAHASLAAYDRTACVRDFRDYHAVLDSKCEVSAGTQSMYQYPGAWCDQLCGLNCGDSSDCFVMAKPTGAIECECKAAGDTPNTLVVVILAASGVLVAAIALCFWFTRYLNEWDTDATAWKRLERMRQDIAARSKGGR